MASEDSLRLAALCSKLGRLSTEKNIEVWEEEPPPAKLAQCRLTLIGRILSNPSINFPAFQSTLKKAWPEQVDFLQREDGLYIVQFHSATDKRRVLEGGPSSTRRLSVVLNFLQLFPISPSGQN